MTTSPTTRGARVGLVLALVLTAGLLAACNSKKPENDLAAAHKFIDSTKAKNAAQTALTMLSTSTPYPKLLVGQFSQPIPATATPVWQFLVGSPKDNTLYAVEVKGGLAHYKEWGSVNMKAPEWSKVPTLAVWKVEFKEAREKALALFPQGKKSAYFANFMTYVPESATDRAAPPMTWIIAFDPKSKGTAPTTTVEVNMVTGATAFAK